MLPEIVLSKVDIKDYRSISSLSLSLRERNVLLGMNNSGKSNILSAINLAFNSGVFTEEDVHISKDAPDPFSKEVDIDLYFLPSNGASTFSAPWLKIFGSQISTNDGLNLFFAFRTSVTYDPIRKLFYISKKVITQWNVDGSKKIGQDLNYRILEHFSCYYINANRDLSADLLDRKSIWTKLVNHVNIPDEQRQNIQKQLDTVNQEIKKESPLLLRLEKTLSESVPEPNIQANIFPVTKDIETLYKGMNVYYSSKDNNLDLPISNFGSGVKSWAVFSTVKSQLEAEAEELKPGYFLLLFEEPESHVHPQEQFRLSKELSSLPYQTVITTHSPYVVCRFELSDLCHVLKKDGNTNVCQIEENAPFDQKFKEEIFQNHGTFLFSNAVIFAEGQTENIALPIFYKKYFDMYPYENGVDFVSIGGGKNYSNYIRVCKYLNINWFIFSDNDDPNIVKSIEKTVKELYGQSNAASVIQNHVVYLPPKTSYETYLYEDGYKDVFEEIIDNFHQTKDFLEKGYSEAANIKAQNSDLSPEQQHEAIFKKYLKGKDRKTTLAGLVANKICETNRPLPSKVVELFTKIKQVQ